MFEVHFGDFEHYDRMQDDLFEVAAVISRFPNIREHEQYYLLAAIRRTLSLEKAFRQSIESCNGQMAATIIRLNLDTLARIYALYWAEETKNMDAESLSKAVAEGKSIRSMNLRGSKSKATDRWLIKQIEGLGDWIPDVYEKTSGAIHFSNFHIDQLIQQSRPVKKLENGSLLAEFVIGATEKDADPELYRELKQAFLHISIIIIAASRHRCELAFANILPDQT